MSVEVEKKKKRSSSGKTGKQVRQTRSFSPSFLAPIIHAILTARREVSTLSCLHDAKKRTSSERDGRGRSSSGGRRARTSSTTLMPLFFVFQRFGYEGNVFGGFCSDNRVEGDCFLPPRRRKKALQRDRGILNGDDEDGIQRCRRFFSRASQRKKRNVRLFLFAVGCSLRERFLTSSRRVRRRCDNSGTHGEQQGAKNEWSKARRDRIQKLSRGEEESDKAISLFFFPKKKKKKKKNWALLDATTTALRAFSPASALSLCFLPIKPIRASQIAFSRPLAAPSRPTSSKTPLPKNVSSLLSLSSASALRAMAPQVDPELLDKATEVAIEAAKEAGKRERDENAFF